MDDPNLIFVFVTWMITVNGVLEDEDSTSEEADGWTVHVNRHDWTILEIKMATFFKKINEWQKMMVLKMLQNFCNG